MITHKYKVGEKVRIKTEEEYEKENIIPFADPEMFGKEVEILKLVEEHDWAEECVPGYLIKDYSTDWGWNEFEFNPIIEPQLEFDF